jgi:hypothetical protein
MLVILIIVLWFKSFAFGHGGFGIDSKNLGIDGLLTIIVKKGSDKISKYIAGSIIILSK